MKFSYNYENIDNISETVLHEVVILSWKCTPLCVNLVLRKIFIMKWNTQKHYSKNKTIVLAYRDSVPYIDAFLLYML